MIYSDNRYNVTLGKFIDSLEDGDYDDLDGDDVCDDVSPSSHIHVPLLSKLLT